MAQIVAIIRIAQPLLPIIDFDVLDPLRIEQRVRTVIAMSGSAGPFIFLSFCNDSSAHRIALDISDRRPKMSVIKHAGEGSSLEKVPADSVFSIEVHRIPAVAAVKSLPNSIRSFRDGDEVYVVCHQTIGADSKSMQETAFRKQTQVELSVFSITEDIETPDTALRDVVSSPGENNTRDSSHNLCSGNSGRTARGVFNVRQNRSDRKWIIKVCVPETSGVNRKGNAFAVSFPEVF